MSTLKDDHRDSSRLGGFVRGKLDGKELFHSRMSTTSRPSLIFSVASSTGSLADHDGYIDFDNHPEFIEGDNCEYDYAGHHERKEGPVEVPSPPGSLTDVSGKRSKVQFWKTRFIELICIQILLLTSIGLYVQNTNRLSLSSANIVGTEELLQMKDDSTNTTSENFGAALGHKAGQEDCIYVPGGGFSGFWFSLGRLQSIVNPHKETFVCYSAGCLGVVSALLRQIEESKNDSNSANYYHYHSIYGMARSIQIEWQSGELHRYRVVEKFIDGLLENIPDDEESRAFFLDTISRNLNVVTTSFEDAHETKGKLAIPQLLPQSIIPGAIVRRPSDIPSLKRLLLQTTWIPLASGSSWTHRGHMDGGLSAAQHPRCSRAVGLTTSAKPTTKSETESSPWYESFEKQVQLWANTLNMDIGPEKVDELWKVGMECGV